MSGQDLNAEALLARAEKETDLSDYGDPTFRERFAIAVDHINSASMDETGRAAAVENCNWLLTSRLEFFEDFKRYPIGEEKIVMPLFATGGEPRSGTTLLHALLASDPDARALRWHLFHLSTRLRGAEDACPDARRWARKLLDGASDNPLTSVLPSREGVV